MRGISRLVASRVTVCSPSKVQRGGPSSPPHARESELRLVWPSCSFASSREERGRQGSRASRVLAQATVAPRVRVPRESSDPNPGRYQILPAALGRGRVRPRDTSRTSARTPQQDVISMTHYSQGVTIIDLTVTKGAIMTYPNTLNLLLGWDA